MAKYTALMVVALLALAGANASRELKQLGGLGGLTGALGGVTGGLIGGGSGGASGGNIDSGNDGNTVGNNGNQENNSNNEQKAVCKNSCQGNFVAVGCCATIGQIANGNNVDVLDLCNNNIDNCCLANAQDVVDAAVGVLGAGLNLEELVGDVAANVGLFSNIASSKAIDTCQQ